MRFSFLVVLLIAAMAAGASPVRAESAREVLSQISKCTEIAAAADRLKCFDAAASQAQPALSAPQEATATAEEAEEEGGVLSWFGFERPAPRKVEDFGKPPARVASTGEITSVSAQVLEFAKNPYGRALFVLDNGQIWKQIEGDNTELRDPRKGETLRITIERGLMGAYNLTVEGRNGVIRVKRVK